jgi:hypothetical protein
MWQAEQPAFTLVSCLVFFFDPGDGGDMFPEKFVDFQRATRNFVPEDRTLHNHRCEILKSYKGHLDVNISLILATE